MSRMRPVRSRSLQSISSSMFFTCTGVNSSSKITRSESCSFVRRASSRTFPDPMKVAGSGLLSDCVIRSVTSAPAVRARCWSSFRWSRTSKRDSCGVITPTMMAVSASFVFSSGVNNGANGL